MNDCSFIASSTEAPTSDKRRAILDAALTLFADRGYANTPVPLVAERAGVATGTLYRYFDSKESLVNSIFREGKLAMAAALPIASDGRGGPSDWPRAVFDRWWSGLWDFASADPVLFRFLETHHHAPYLNAASSAVARAIDDAAEVFVAAAQQAGVFRPGDPAALVALVFGAFVGLVRGGLNVEANRSTSEDAAWSLLAVPPSSPTRKAIH